jgi:hypothetical protein
VPPLSHRRRRRRRLIFILPAGALVDRWNRKRVMIRCDSARFLAYGSIPLAFALEHLFGDELPLC